MRYYSGDKEVKVIKHFISRLFTLSIVIRKETASWSSCGSKYLVKEPKKFKKSVKELFYTKKFKRAASKEDNYEWGFSHPDFERDNPKRMNSIKPTKRQRSMDGKREYDPFHNESVPFISLYTTSPKRIKLESEKVSDSCVEDEVSLWTGVVDLLGHCQ
eukprot:maker-scaffold_3-snap-gene-10.51-mRNA-1 protein AED:0.07 eAED:0.39 QI:0/0/0.5/1/0/0/2/91/158